MKDIQQLIKKDNQQGKYANIYPKTYTDAIIDKQSGKSLHDILLSFNMYFLNYTGNTATTRLKVPAIVRKRGLWITYVKYDNNVYTEWYAGEQTDDTSWQDSANWRVGNSSLVGDITISSNGNWIVNGIETGFKAIGEAGITPILRIQDNKLQVSYNQGTSYTNISDTPIYTRFRWQATTGASQSSTIGRIQASTDDGKSWTNMSDDFINNLHISKYIGANESLPTSGIPVGTIYAKGPTYAEDDTNNDNPIYRLWVYAYKGDTLAWQDNGEFRSIAAGVVQDFGESETQVISQKPITRVVDALGSTNLVPEFTIIEGERINRLGAIITGTTSSRTSPIKMNQGDVLILKCSESSLDVPEASVVSEVTKDNQFVKSLQTTGLVNKVVIISQKNQFVSVCMYTNRYDTAEIRLYKFQQIRNLLNTVNSNNQTITDLLLINTQDLQYNVIENKYIDYTAGIKEYKDRGMTTPIFVSTGSIITIKTIDNSSLGSSSMAIISQTDNQGNPIKVILTGDSNPTDISYHVTESMYIVISGYLSRFQNNIIVSQKLSSQIIEDIISNIEQSKNTIQQLQNNIIDKSYFVNQRGYDYVSGKFIYNNEYLKSTNLFRVFPNQLIQINNLVCSSSIYAITKYDEAFNIIGGYAIYNSSTLVPTYKVEHNVKYISFTAYTKISSFQNIEIQLVNTQDTSRLLPYFDNYITITKSDIVSSTLGYNAFVSSVMYQNILYIFYMKSSTHTASNGDARIAYKYSTNSGNSWSEEFFLTSSIEDCIPQALNIPENYYKEFYSGTPFISENKLFMLSDLRYWQSTSTVYKKTIFFYLIKNSDNTLAIQFKILAPAAYGPTVDSDISISYNPNVYNTFNSIISSPVMIHNDWAYWISYANYTMNLFRIKPSAIENSSVLDSTNCEYLYTWYDLEDNYNYTESVLIKSDNILYCIVRHEVRDSSQPDYLKGDKLFFSKDEGHTWNYWKQVIQLDKPFSIELPNQNKFVLLGRVQTPSEYGQSHYTTLNVLSKNMDQILVCENYDIGDNYFIRDCGYESAQIINDELYIFYYKALQGQSNTLADIRMTKIPLTVFENIH